MALRNQEPGIVLASTSPRRKELLALSGLQFRVGAVEIDETPAPGEDAYKYVSRVARAKANAAAKKVEKGEVVIAADTIVIFENEIMGKPKDDQDAANMLDRLRNNTHQVVTSLVVALPSSGNMVISEMAVTDVPMRNYSDQEVGAYITSGDPLDKAGSYAIQHHGFHPVEHLQGCYANVVGLPLCHLTRAMNKLDINGMENVPTNCQNHLKYDCPVYEQVLKGEL